MMLPATCLTYRFKPPRHFTDISWYLFDAYNRADEQIKKDRDEGIPVNDSEVHERDFYYYSSIFFVIFAILIVIVVIFLREDIRKSIDLYKEASEAIRAMPTMLLAPFLTYVQHTRLLLVDFLSTSRLFYCFAVFGFAIGLSSLCA